MATIKKAVQAANGRARPAKRPAREEAEAAVRTLLLWAGAASLLWRTRPRPASPEPDTQLIPIFAGAGSPR